MENIKTFFVAFAVFLGIDMVWLKLSLRSFTRRKSGI